MSDDSQIAPMAFVSPQFQVQGWVRCEHFAADKGWRLRAGGMLPGSLLLPFQLVIFGVTLIVSISRI